MVDGVHIFLQFLLQQLSGFLFIRCSGGIQVCLAYLFSPL